MISSLCSVSREGTSCAHRVRALSAPGPVLPLPLQWCFSFMDAFSGFHDLTKLCLFGVRDKFTYDGNTIWRRYHRDTSDALHGSHCGVTSAC